MKNCLLKRIVTLSLSAALLMTGAGVADLAEVHASVQNSHAVQATSQKVKYDPKININYGRTQNAHTGDLTAKLSWTKENASKVTYEVQRSTKSNSDFKKIATVSTNVYVDKTVVCGTKYYYRVVVKVNGKAKDTVYTGDIDFTGETELGADVSKEGSALIYAYSEVPFTGYYIYRSSKADSDFKKIGTCYKSYFVDKGAKVGQKYYYKVQAFRYCNKDKKIHNFKMSEAELFNNVVGCYDANLQFKNKNANTVTVSWDKVPGAAKYELWVFDTEVANGDSTLVYSGNKTSCAVTCTDAQKDYGYYLIAIDKSGKYEDTYNAYYTMKEKVYPEVKESRGASNGKLYRTITFSWAKATEVSKVTFTKYTNYGSNATSTEIPVSKKSYSIKCTGGNDINYAMEFQFKDGSTYRDSYSNELLLSDAKNVKAKMKSDTSATITWSAVAGAKQYEVYKYAEDGSCWLVGTTKKTSIDDKYVQPGLRYVYEVIPSKEEAEIGDFEGYDTKFGSFFNYYQEVYLKNELIKKATDRTIYVHEFNSPSLTSVKNSASKTSEITWKKNTAATGYEIYRSTKENGTYTKVASVGASTVSYKDTKLTKGTTYYYYVIATCKTDSGATAKSKASAKKSVKISK